MERAHGRGAGAESRARSMPLYFQLAEQLRDQIDSGALPPGSKLPTAGDLAKEMRISRMTARQAISQLAQQGRVIIKPGVGSFVAEPKLTHDSLHVLGFTEEMLRLGQEPSSIVLERRFVEAAPSIAAALQIRSGERVIRIVRLRLLATEPVLLETIHLPEQLVPDIERGDLATMSVYDHLRSRGLVISHAQQTIEATTASKDEARLLRISPGTTLLLVEGTTYASGWRPVEAFAARYRGDKFKLSVRSWVEEPRSTEVAVLLKD